MFVPLPGARCSVVWVTSPTEAERLKGLGDEELSEAAEKQSHSIFGRVRSSRAALCSRSRSSDQAAPAHRVVLVGEAAHVVPPIGAQGLNLGLRDADDIAAIVRDALASDQDPGGRAVMSRYAAARRADVLSRTMVIDLANRSLLSELLPMQSLRAAGLHLIGAIGPLRRLAMREGLAPSWRTAETPSSRRRSSPVMQASRRAEASG